MQESQIFSYFSLLTTLVVVTGFTCMTCRFFMTFYSIFRSGLFFSSKRSETDHQNEKNDFIESILQKLREQEAMGATSLAHMDATKDAKARIKYLFDKNIRGQVFHPPALSSSHSSSHSSSCCKVIKASDEGHWLEERFGLQANCHGGADLFGYEIKKASDKITFGDWAADEYIFRPGAVLLQHNPHVPLGALDKDAFLYLFGLYNDTHGRFSWSGLTSPRLNQVNAYGQMLVMDAQENLFVVYHPHFDVSVADKPNWVWHSEVTVLAFWSRAKIDRHVTQKFNQRGFLLCKKRQEDGVYTDLCFGRPINTGMWLDSVRKGLVFLDSGMTEGNRRNYSMWRAHARFWDTLIEEVY